MTQGQIDKLNGLLREAHQIMPKRHNEEKRELLEQIQTLMSKCDHKYPNGLTAKPMGMCNICGVE